MRVAAYVNRGDFIVERVRGKRVLDCGVVGLTLHDDEERVNGIGESLHWRISVAAREAVGIDNSPLVKEIARRNPSLALIEMAVEDAASALKGAPRFDVVILGDLLEHVSNAGLALDAIRSVLGDGGEIVVTCPNAFSGPGFLRFLLGRYREGDDHVASYSKWTLGNLLARHGFLVREVLTAVDHTPRSRGRRVVHSAFTPVLRRLPELGGTLIVVARQAGPPREAP